MDRKEIARQLFYEGFNCSQSVAMAFEDILPINRDNIQAVASAFGGGFSRSRNLCGTLSAVGMVLGLLEQGTGNIADDKQSTYKCVRNATDKFIKANGTIVCKDLLANIKNLTSDFVPSIRDEKYYNERPCIKFVIDCVNFIEESEIYKDTIKAKE